MGLTRMRRMQWSGAPRACLAGLCSLAKSTGLLKRAESHRVSYTERLQGTRCLPVTLPCSWVGDTCNKCVYAVQDGGWP